MKYKALSVPAVLSLAFVSTMLVATENASLQTQAIETAVQMVRLSEKLRDGQSHLEVQRQGDAILDSLDAMINALEKENNQQDSSSESSTQQQQDESQKSDESKPTNSGSPSRKSDSSSQAMTAPSSNQNASSQPGQGGLHYGKGEGKVENKQLSSREEWGGMPPMERKEFLRKVDQNFPPYYRTLIEQYFQKVGQEKKKDQQ